MEKIKINLMSGSSLEKPLITAFKSNGNTYVVFDNEINGTMGLPIILVSKLVNNTLTKIVDNNEWGAVKESLRMIIAGNQVDYVTCSESLGAEDVFFSQLTLPVASFDALKNNYKPVVDNIVSQPAAVSNMDASQVNADFVSPVSSELINLGMAGSQQNITNNLGGISEAIPVNNMVGNMAPGGDQFNNIAPSIESQVQVSPVMPSAPLESQSMAQVSSEPTNVEPIPDVAIQQNVPVDFTADKEAFLKACENMFDALVAKFKN